MTDTTCVETEKIEVLILKIGENGMLRNEEGRTRNSAGQFINAQESIYYIYKIRSDLEISDDFGAFWRYLEQAPEITVELDHWYIPSSTRSNKETQLLYSPDLGSLENLIRKEARSSSIDNNTCSSLDFVQPPSTQTLISSTDTRPTPSTVDTHLPSTDIVHPTSIDTPSQTSIDIEPRDMVAILILVRDDNGDLYEQEGNLRNSAG
ncbi:hypothetical protein DY000_02007639 [Brassica cretica]|uniref:Uncharacterized protein n=1 Tax=Brassica cretica TaxID=69181 RepID=A0ABQ7CMM4_BRACR|nr:hypothetical protein DY000_02007639 [Brassica cretica]